MKVQVIQFESSTISGISGIVRTNPGFTEVVKYWCIHSLPYVVEGVGGAAHIKQLVVHNSDSPHPHIDRLCHALLQQ